MALVSADYGSDVSDEDVEDDSILKQVLQFFLAATDYLQSTSGKIPASCPRVLHL